ncbi:relA-associated inhibitor [Protobothrops mucrosquamatus]|uniref:relA-associated inhibitor n=1 Tax=Protobothrops mucrosquamatus TaxID=103944 RepID=UPI0010FB2516|nr:relA-associated inhibitor [Protobothrops mucrosquamatus]
MASQDLASAQELLDLTFQSLACKHMDLKQLELDTAAAKVDELSKQLESLWTDHPGPPIVPSLVVDRYRSSSSPDLLKMEARAASPLHQLPLRKSPTWDIAEPSGPPSMSPYSSSPSQLLAPNRTWTGAPQHPPGPRSWPSLTRAHLAPGPMVAPPAPSERPAFLSANDLVIRRRPPKSWNESDLDVAYEKKAPHPVGYEPLACKHMDLKQLELDTAAAKVDELSKQLESLWTDHPGPPIVPSLVVDRYRSSSSPDLLKMEARAASPLHQLPLRKSPTWDIAEPSGPPSMSPYSSSPSQLLAPKPTLGRPSSPRPSFFLQSDVDWSPTAPSRPKVMAIPYEGPSGPGAHGGSPRSLRTAGLPERQFDYRPFPATGGWGGRAGSPRLPGEGSISQAFFPERGPSPRPPLPPPYESHSLYPSAPGSFRAQDDLVIRRRPPKSWNESDLDVAYEKKAPHPVGYERVDAHASLRQNPAGLPPAPWKESSLDGGWPGKEEHYGMHSATLPRNYKVSALAGERRPDSSLRRSLVANQAGTLPRNWQPISRIPIPPPALQGGSLPRRHKPLPLSMIFRLQNAFWESGAAGGKLGLPPGPVGSPLGSPLALRSLQKLLMQPPAAPLQPSHWTMGPSSEGSGSPRAPAGPTERIVPIVLMPGDAEAELENLLPGSEPAEMDDLARPLSPTRLQPVLPPEAQKVPEFEEVARVLAEMPRPLKRRGSMEQNPSPALLPPHKKQYQQIISRLFHHPPRKEETTPVGDPPLLGDLSPVPEAAEQKGAPATPSPAMTPPPAPESPATLSPVPSPEKRSVLRKVSSPRKWTTKKARLNPLVLLLDAALTGELDVVKEAVKELNDPSQPNDEGITALHNAICGANYSIVDFLINIGANVNSPDSHGWTPLHCAASCNDTAICIALVKHGAAIFASTFSDGSLAIEKCDPYREGYNECFSYLADMEQNMGLMNNGVVYALWDYSAEFSDELSFREGEPVTVLRRDGPEELDWWWASLYGQEGYVPKNYFGLFPRVRPQQRKT